MLLSPVLSKKREPNTINQPLYYSRFPIGPQMMFYTALCSLKHNIANYQLRIPMTYQANEEKLLVYDQAKGYLTQVESFKVALFQNALLNEAQKYLNTNCGDRQKMELPAYLFAKKYSLKLYYTNGVHFHQQMYYLLNRK